VALRLSQRRKLLIYLRRSNFEAYANVLDRLNLKDSYIRMDRLTLRMTLKATENLKAKQKKAQMKS
jgi:hypothetical protein